MKPGSLVICGYQNDTSMIGIVIGKSTETNNYWRDKPYQWWEVLYGDKIAVKSETVFKLVG